MSWAAQLPRRIIACGWRTIVVRALVLGAAWWILSEGDASGLAFGAPVVAVALLTSLALPSPRRARWRLFGLVRFAFVFVAGSLRGGIDVARRALAPRLPISPAVISYTLRVPDGMPRNLFLGTFSVMPGTLGLECEGRRLHIHVLAHDTPHEHDLDVLERAVSAATGVALEGSRA